MTLATAVANELRQQATVLSSYWPVPRRRPADEVPLAVLEDDNLITRVIRSGRDWEGWLSPTLLRYSRPDRVSLDVGANIGVHSLTLAANSLVVHSFEPSAVTYGVLVRNAKPYSNIRAHRAAASSSAGPAMLQRDSRNYGAASITEDASGSVEEISCVRLDDLDFEAPVAFMKIDVEGHEQAALAGAMSLIARDRPTIVLEDMTGARAALQALGYQCSRISLHDYLCTPR